MLNELLALDRQLSAAPARNLPRHPDVKDVARSDILRIRLGGSGEIADMEWVNRAAGPIVWTLRDGQQNGFPAFRLPAADLLACRQFGDAAHDTLRTPVQRADLLEEFLRSGEIADWPRHSFRDRLAQRHLQLRDLSQDPSAASVPAVFDRFLVLIDRPTSFMALVLAEIQRRANLDARWHAAPEALFAGTLCLACDVAKGDYARDALDREQIDAVSAQLWRHERVHECLPESAPACALSGARDNVIFGRFPQPNLPGVGQTYLFVRNDRVPALARYGQGGAASFPLDCVLAARLAGTLTSLTGAELRGKTWQLIPADSGDRQDLLIAYGGPRSRFSFANALAGGNAAPALSSDRHCDAQRIPVSDPPSHEVRLLILRSLDKTNRKIVFETSMCVGALSAALERWYAAMANLPSVLHAKACQALPPLSLIAVSRRLFVDGGRRRIDIAGASARDALALFLSEAGMPQIARRTLALLVTRNWALLANIAHRERHGPAWFALNDPDGSFRRDAREAVAWLGALLYVVGSPVHTYQRGFAYRLGQILAAADEMHSGYCASRGTGGAPSTLVGFDLLSQAARDPMRALRVWHLRRTPYDRWVRDTEASDAACNMTDTKRDMIRAGLRGAALERRLSSELWVQLQPVEIDDRYRAALLLGYTAGTHDEDSHAESRIIPSVQEAAVMHAP